jgi:hypothetical protein
LTITCVSARLFGCSDAAGTTLTAKDDVMDFIVNRADLTQTQWVKGPVDANVAVGQGQVLVEIEKFAFTANNITYAVAGDMLNYWSFFPADAGWGRIPVWGYASVLCSRCEGITEGERLYGYFPMSSHLLMQPESVSSASFLDLYKQRRDLHPVYNTYNRVPQASTTPQGLDDLRPILSPPTPPPF